MIRSNRKGLAMVTHIDDAIEVSVETALAILRRLTPEDRLRVIAALLPETVAEVLSRRADTEAPGAQRSPDGPDSSQDETTKRSRGSGSLHGLWKGMGFDVTVEDIDEARREMWTNTRREDA
jgi:hypothetical protein